MNEFEHLHNGEANYIYVQDCINRYSTGASAVIHGVKEGEKSLYTTMWTMLGFPLTSVPVPVWLTSEGVLPSIMMGCATKEAVMCNMSLRLKKEIIASSRGEMKYYINTTKVVNSEGLGCSQRLAPVRRKVFERGMKLREGMEKGF